MSGLGDTVTDPQTANKVLMCDFEFARSGWAALKALMHIDGTSIKGSRLGSEFARQIVPLIPLTVLSTCRSVVQDRGPQRAKRQQLKHRQAHRMIIHRLVHQHHPGRQEKNITCLAHGGTQRWNIFQRRDLASLQLEQPFQAVLHGVLKCQLLLTIQSQKAPPPRSPHNESHGPWGHGQQITWVCKTVGRHT